MVKLPSPSFSIAQIPLCLPPSLPSSATAHLTHLSKRYSSTKIIKLTTYLAVTAHSPRLRPPQHLQPHRALGLGALGPGPARHAPARRGTRRRAHLVHFGATAGAVAAPAGVAAAGLGGDAGVGAHGAPAQDVRGRGADPPRHGAQADARRRVAAPGPRRRPAGRPRGRAARPRGRRRLG
ncbi:hypothetical protein F4778DRAFT_616150 [Xylariomycetidae sp. FL2044]|nr:hypothetical protein F4778DRAFT_616150 [Xylariomycetidae sp. FL2044]